MKNKDFFYLQYNKINWKNQTETKINSFINNISIFDNGFVCTLFVFNKC